jgi:DNA-dependent RNA polymerase auxiliary subunit epsilon
MDVDMEIESAEKSPVRETVPTKIKSVFNDFKKYAASREDQDDDKFHKEFMDALKSKRKLEAA